MSTNDNKNNGRGGATPLERFRAGESLVSTVADAGLPVSPWGEGYDAKAAGQQLNDCPYDPDENPTDWAEWTAGWYDRG